MRVARYGPSRHHRDLSRVLGNTLDIREGHYVNKAVARNVGVLKGLDGKITSIKIRTLSREINLKIKNVLKATPLASGNIFLEFASMEALNKALYLPKFKLGGIECTIKGLPQERLYEVVIHGIPLEEDLAEFQHKLEYDRSDGASLVRVDRLQNKHRQDSGAVKLTFAGGCPIIVSIAGEGTEIVYRTETYVHPPKRCFLCQGYGHISKSCKNKVTCGRCAGGHNTRACTSDNIRCSNCGEKHVAAYTGCNEYVKATAIMVLVRTRRVNWGKATALFYKELEQLKAEEDRGLLPVRPLEMTNTQPPFSPHRGEGGESMGELRDGVGVDNSTSMPSPPISPIWGNGINTHTPGSPCGERGGLGVNVNILGVSVEGESPPSGLTPPISPYGGNGVPNKSPIKSYGDIVKTKTPQGSLPKISLVGGCGDSLPNIPL